MGNKTGLRNSAKEIVLSDELSLRFSWHVITTNGKAEPYKNEISMHLHSLKLKCRVGVIERVRYSFTKKRNDEIKTLIASGCEMPPQPQVPKVDDILTAIVSTFSKNCGLTLCQSRGNNSKPANKAKTVELNPAILSVFWLNQMDAICIKNWATIEERKNAKKMMAHIVLAFGALDLSHFVGKDRAEFLDYVYEQLNGVVGGKTHVCTYLDIIRCAIGGEITAPTKHDDSEQPRIVVTNRMREYSRVLWKVINEYLFLYYSDDQSSSTSEEAISTADQGIFDIDSYRAAYFARFRSKTMKARAISRNLVPKTLSRDEYKNLYVKLTQERPITDINLALLIMLFMGLSVEETCGLNTGDVIPIINYNAASSVRVVKEYRKNISLKTVRGKKKEEASRCFLAYDLDESEQYRNIPIPLLILRLLTDRDSSEKEHKSVRQDDDPLFFDKNRHRLKPDDLMRSFKNLFNTSAERLNIRKGDEKKEVRLQFKPEYYRISLRNLWALFGMRDGEIRYLLGQAQRSTAADHYIDFNNPHMQYCMRTQMSYAMSNVAAESSLNDAGQHELFFRAERRKFYSKGGSDYRRHVRLRIMKPAKITLASHHGISIVRVGEENE